MPKKIIIRGARVHNLKNISLEIPRDKLVVFTGLSGSGKSSLAFDTIYAEGQRRYVESLSAYARQFLGLMDKPDVDQIEGLSPAISIDQKSASSNPRSTVGTITEIYDYLRLLFARVGKPHCLSCGKPITAQTASQITDKILALPRNSRVIILAPLVRDRKGEHKREMTEIQRAGFVRVRLDGVILELEEALQGNINPKKKHTLEIVVDRLEISGNKENRERVADSTETALNLGNSLIIVHNLNTSEDLLFSENFACPECGLSLPTLEPRDFSFNSPHGACPECTGLGTKLEVDPLLVIPNKRLSIYEGAIRPWARSASRNGWYIQMLEAVASYYGFSLSTPVAGLKKKDLEIILYGTADTRIPTAFKRDYRYLQAEIPFEGVIPNLARRYQETESDYVRREIEKYMRIYPCPTCNGMRLKKEILGVKIMGRSIVDIAQKDIDQAFAFFQNLEKDLNARDKIIAKQILKEICARLSFLQNVGLSYLTLDRPAASLAGGESQRIRLATQIGSALVGVLYILDEPSVGLHQKDNVRLIETLKKLRDQGNTVIVVEHDEEMILNADFIVDIGPGAGREGGAIVACGTPAEIKRNKCSLTGQYLSHHLEIPLPQKYRPGSHKKITIYGASAHNLKEITAEIPLGKLVCVTGVSGSGKSTLICDILARSLAQYFYRARTLPAKHKKITGFSYLDKVISIDQSPIGRTPRSNPATYTGAFTHIRDLYAATQEAKIRGYRAGRFSFNVKGGRCEACRGEGLVRIEMQFLPDVYVECEECKGTRYNKEALEIYYKDKNIADVLKMTVAEALQFFRNVPAIYQKLMVLCDVGLDYIQLGQPAPTLSGGEAQRVKLASELARRATGKTLYILDEPTTGLHFHDVGRLLAVLNQLVDKGNTVLVIEHNLDVIKSADWIIDLGPDGGEAGGYLVAAGTPRQVAKVKASYTGQFLKKYF
ncbi:MAG: excinuclease ABC subunit A [Parcubacteria group bacterium LiPW_72]|nr:MAG: excinuclease ABC subunit A [Parcubacteria group bacterium LiPW_72]